MAFKPTEKHWELLLSYLESHPGVTIGRVDGPNGRRQLKNHWEELAIRLNSLGYGSRSGDKWRKTWTDFKYNLKEKHSQISQNMKTTGGGEAHIFLNTFEERAIHLLGNTFSLGVGVREVGLSQNSALVEELPGNRSASCSQEMELPPINQAVKKPAASTQLQCSPASSQEHN